MTSIVQTPRVLGGRKRISGTRISVDLIYNYVRDNNIKKIQKDYPHLSKKQIKTALDYFDKGVDRAKEQLESSPA